MVSGLDVGLRFRVEMLVETNGGAVYTQAFSFRLSAPGFALRVQGLGFMVQGSGFRGSSIFRGWMLVCFWLGR